MMKTLRIVKLIAVICFFSSVSRQTSGAEFLVFNDTITFVESGNYGFYFFPRNGSMPSNWASPNDYWNGQFYTRYEIISQPTNHACGFEFALWQWQPNSTVRDHISETVEYLRRTDGGPGATVYTNSSPSGWYHKAGGVDFSRPNDFYSLGIILWSIDPTGFVAPPDDNWHGDPDVWAVRHNFFPITIVATVVAVSNGSTFSGWHNYLSQKPPTPSYSVNYFNETTTQAVSSADEYSYAGDMSSAIDGTNQVLNLTPGQDVYFRTKALGYNPASDIQHMVVNGRPAAPVITPDFVNEQTHQTVGSDTEFSNSPDFSSSSAGDGTTIDLVPGQDLYFRKKATSIAFCSPAVSLDIPERPAAPVITINYLQEQSNEVVTSGDEYGPNEDFSESVVGSDDVIDISPGIDLYFRKMATDNSFYSLPFMLEVKDRDSIPVFTIDFENRTTNEPVNDEVAYSTSSDMSGSVIGIGDPVIVTPDEDLYFQRIASDTSFSSETFHLEVPARNLLVYEGENPFSEEKIECQVVLIDEGLTFELDHLEITNGVAQDLRGDNYFDIYPDEYGEVSVILPANTVDTNTFASNELLLNYVKNVSIEETGNIEFLIYPVPSQDGLLHIQVPVSGSVIVEVLSLEGKMLLRSKESNTQDVSINTGDLSSGTYVVRVIADDKTFIKKIILQ